MLPVWECVWLHFKWLLCFPAPDSLCVYVPVGQEGTLMRFDVKHGNWLLLMAVFKARTPSFTAWFSGNWEGKNQASLSPEKPLGFRDGAGARSGAGDSMRQSCEHRKPSQALGSAHDRQFLEQDSKEVPPGCKITAHRTIIEPLSPWRKYLGGSIT